MAATWRPNNAIERTALRLRQTMRQLLEKWRLRQYHRRAAAHRHVIPARSTGRRRETSAPIEAATHQEGALGSQPDGPLQLYAV